MSILHDELNFRRPPFATIIYVIIVALLHVLIVPASAFAQSPADPAMGEETIDRLPAVPPIPVDDSIDSVTAADEAAFAEFLAGGDDEPYDLILEVRRSSQEALARDLVGLEKNGQAYIPVGELGRLLKFSVQVDLENGTAAGWFLDEENIFTLDTRDGFIQTKDKRYTLTAGDFLIQEYGYGIGDIYLTPSMLNKLWPLGFRLDYSTLSLWIETPRLLPFELQQNFKNRKAAFQEAQRLKDARFALSQAQIARLTYLPYDYKIFSLPRVNIGTSFVWNNPERLIENDTSVVGANDFLGTVADYTTRFSYDSNSQSTSLDRLRLRFTRTSYQDDDLPFNLQFLQFGDIGIGTDPLISDTVSGRGVTVSNSPKQIDNTFDEVTIEGLAQPGWDIEIYIDNILYDIGVVPDDGIYRFEDVPINFGDNEVTIRLYGPLGQVEERTENYDVFGSRIPRGKTYYQASVLDTDKPLIPLQSENTSENKGIKAFKLRALHGLNKYMTAFASFTDLPTKEEEKQYVTGGVDFSAFDGSGRIQIYKELGGGSAIDTRFATSILGFNINLSNAWLYDFESQQAGYNSGQKTFESGLRISKTLNTDFGTLNLKLSGTHTERDNNTRSSQISFSQGINAHKLKLTNTNRASITDDQLVSVTGTLGSNIRLGRSFRARGNLIYKVQPTFELSTFQGQGTYNWGKNRDFVTTFDLTQDLQKKGTSAGFGFGYDFETFLASIDFDWTRGRGVNVGLRASTSLAPFGPNGGYVMRSKNLVNASGINARVFVDKDGDGIFGPDDVPVENAQFRANARKSEFSDNEGRISQYGLLTSGMTNLTLEPSTLFNPFYKSKHPGYRTLIRPGSVVNIDYPIEETGAIDGFLSFPDGRTLPGIIVELIDMEGRIIDETTTMFDGFFQFDYVFPGTYQLRLSPSQDQIYIQPYTLTVDVKEPFVFGLELMIQEQPKTVPDAPAPLTSASQKDGRIAQTPTPEPAETKDSAPPETDAPEPGPVPDITPVSPQPSPEPTDITPVEIQGLQDIKVHRVRFGEYPDKLRLVLDLSAAPAYRLVPQTDRAELIIDLPHTAWQAGAQRADLDLPLVRSYTISRDTGLEEHTRIILKADKPLRVMQDGLLPALDGDGMRLFIDLEAAD